MLNTLLQHQLRDLVVALQSIDPTLQSLGAAHHIIHTLPPDGHKAWSTYIDELVRQTEPRLVHKLLLTASRPLNHYVAYAPGELRNTFVRIQQQFTTVLRATDPVI